MLGEKSEIKQEQVIKQMLIDNDCRVYSRKEIKCVENPRLKIDFIVFTKNPEMTNPLGIEVESNDGFSRITDSVKRQINGDYLDKHWIIENKTYKPTLAVGSVSSFLIKPYRLYVPEGKNGTQEIAQNECCATNIQRANLRWAARLGSGVIENSSRGLELIHMRVDNFGRKEFVRSYFKKQNDTGWTKPIRAWNE